MNDHELLTCAQLAARIGPRRAGRPTSAACVRDWMLRGRSGVRLPSRFDGVARRTTWAEYLRWREEVTDRREAEREGRRGAVAAVAGGKARQQAARAKLEAMGLR